MSPLEIEIAIFYHTRAEGDYGLHLGDHNFRASAVQSAFNYFVEIGLLERLPPGSPRSFARTDALAVYVGAICGVPAPIQKWVIPGART